MYHVTKAKVEVEDRIGSEMGNVGNDRSDNQMSMRDFLYFYDRIYYTYKYNQHCHTPKVLLSVILSRVLKYLGNRSESEIFALQWHVNIKHYSTGRENKYVLSWSGKNKNKKGVVKYKENNSVTIHQSQYEKFGLYEAIKLLEQIKPAHVKDDAFFPYPKHRWGYLHYICICLLNANS